MNYSNQMFLCGAVNRTSREILLNIRFVTWRPAVALTWKVYGQLREALSGVWINANGSGSKAVEEGQ